jgi:hypothetical protein
MDRNLPSNLLTSRTTNARLAQNQTVIEHNRVCGLLDGDVTNPCNARFPPYLSSLPKAMSSTKTGLEPSKGITDMYDIPSL